MSKTMEELREFISAMAMQQEKDRVQQEKDRVQQEKDRVQQEKDRVQQEKRSKEIDLRRERDRKESQKKSDALDLRFDKILGEFEGVKKSNGEMSEDFFYTSLSKTKKLGGITYDNVDNNWKIFDKKTGIKDQYDVVMINGKELAIVEVKYKAKVENIAQLDKKIKNFHTLYPRYKDYIVHGAIAGLTISPQTEEKILESGYSVIKAQGDHIEIANPKVLK